MTLVVPPPAFGGELTGLVSTEARYFFSPPLFDGQEDHAASVAAEVEYHSALGEGYSFTMKPFARADSADSERSHLDLREFYLLKVAGDWEFGAGVGKVFWGVTESEHLVDIVNQTDLVESVDGEEKLGQPMLTLSVPTNVATLEFLMLPYFRERTFPGKDGRLRSFIHVDTDQASYEDGRGEGHVDWAARVSATVGDMDAAVSYFTGTSREPSLSVGVDGSGNPVFVPFYYQLEQFGVDALLVAGEWLWKAEAVTRDAVGGDYEAFAGGFEYTAVGVFGTQMDVGVIAEWLYDSRGEGGGNPFENDIMLGLRFVVNDVSGTEALVGIVEDLDDSSRVVSLESSRRYSDNIKFVLEGRLFQEMETKDPLYSYRDDDHLQFEAVYYF